MLICTILLGVLPWTNGEKTHAAGPEQGSPAALASPRRGRAPARSPGRAPGRSWGLFPAGAAALESPGGSRGSLKGCSPGQGPRWSRETGQEAGAGLRGSHGLAHGTGTGAGVGGGGVEEFEGKGGFVSYHSNLIGKTLIFPSLSLFFPRQ